jgi:hypothetical protein
MHVLVLHDGACSTPHLPQRGLKADSLQLLASAATHAIVGSAVLTIALMTSTPATPARPAAVDAPLAVDVSGIVFIAREPTPPGGGGGGNQQPGPIRRAQGIGRDAITLRIAKPIATAEQAMDKPLPALVLDAKPLASGTFELTGLPDVDVAAGISTGPGRGDGVGDGDGLGIGPGRGPGIGDGVYRPGGSVTSPRVVTQVRPA